MCGRCNCAVYDCRYSPTTSKNMLSETCWITTPSAPTVQLFLHCTRVHCLRVCYIYCRGIEFKNDYKRISVEMKSIYITKQTLNQYIYIESKD